MTIEAEVIEDSIWLGRRIVSMQVRYPRFIHSELMTHRMFSRNAASSRAIPFKTQMKATMGDIATFVHWGKNQPGMQANEELEGWALKFAQLIWYTTFWLVLGMSQLMALTGSHKQVINRMLEPWTHITVLVTSTEWDNFFKLRLHETAQPEIRALAVKMELAIGLSKPVKRKYHLPYITDFERSRSEHTLMVLMLISAARCARLSYTTHGSIRKDIQKDILLASRLQNQEHWSPFEHAAIGIPTPPTVLRDNQKAWRANFFGWESFRYSLEHGIQDAEKNNGQP